jgi:hypothetical protein
MFGLVLLGRLMRRSVVSSLAVELLLVLGNFSTVKCASGRYKRGNGPERYRRIVASAEFKVRSYLGA